MTVNPSENGTIAARPVDALFPGRVEALRAGVCRRCREAVDVEGMSDDVTRAEWHISGLCESCQTVVYTAMAGDAE